MERRTFIQKSSLFSASLLAGRKLPFAMNFYPEDTSALRHLASASSFPNVFIPEKKRIPLGWKSMPVVSAQSGEAPTILYFNSLDSKAINSPVYLRITAALDFREEKIIRVYLPESGIELGLLVMKFAHPFQPFEIPIETKYLKEIRKQGVALTMSQGNTEAWFFRENADVKNNQGLQPHLLAGGSKDKLQAFEENLYSMNSFSPFGWMGGCVLDALYELHLQGDEQASETLKLHLSHFLDDDKGIIFENPHTVPLDGTFNSIEDFLPLTAIAGLYPNHISLEKGLSFMLEHQNENGIILNGDITTEGCYTLAYPLAALAVIKKDASLAQVALDQLSSRMQHLTIESGQTSAIFQRADLEGKQSYRNWGRGVAWYLLGSVKTYRLLDTNGYGRTEDLAKVKAFLAFHIPWIVKLQNRKGMWSAYLDRPETGIDTSATAGIAAAIAWCCQVDILEKKKYLPMAEKAYEGLQSHLSEDGFLRNVSQINRGGEELQSSGYRVISQFGMGLMAQLKAAIYQAKA
ncbi:glycoside hydrolase family 88 protein [Catalinimonas sp. 4WD22]|uniref:glycoside hydrolase family 88 protein n=1 Tax=Catalinimonas locisalis TaxID=3133978 RepID=UPI003101A43F